MQASVGGKLAQLGARLIDGTAKKMSDEFLEISMNCLVQKVAFDLGQSIFETNENDL